MLAALERASAEREAFIASACIGDERLHAEVSWMLEAAEITGDPDFMPELLPPDLAGASVTAAAPTNYRVLNRLGEGGMGVVYLAERGVGGERQQVALKFLQGTGWADPVVRQRFAEERRILATLSHPNIAHLVDGGDTADGRPYLALEYVEGERIDRWCEQRKLPLRERLALFLKVCAAVQYAHNHLVIHRDIKPPNILVNAEGEPKLLDFGIARLIDHVGGMAAAQTMTVQRALTLAYASPEQVRGESLGTAADVWSLGVVLYQLVCGVRPFEPASELSPLDLSNAIVTGNFRAPSWQWRRLQPKAGRLPADIDAIVLKALRRQPAERYASVDELSADVRRFLAARPVFARQGRFGYRLRLFARRNRLALGAGVFLLAWLAIFLAGREGQLRRVQLERDKTQAIAGFMSELFENADPTHARGNRITVREVLDRGAAELQMRQDIAPQVRAALLLSIGRAYNQLDMGGRAIPLLRTASALQKTDGASALEQGRVLAALGRAYSMMIDMPSSVATDKQAIALLSKSPGDHADEILRVRLNLLYGQLATMDIPLPQIAAQMKDIVASFDNGQRKNPELQAQALADYSMTLGAASDPASVATAQRALDIAHRLYQPDDPALVYYRFTLALVMMRSDPAGAVALYRQVIADYDRTIGVPGPGMAGMSGILTYFGEALAQLGQPAEAARALERSARIAKGFAGDSPDFYLGTLLALTAQYVELGHVGDAQALLAPHRQQIIERMKSGSAWAVNNAIDAFNLSGRVALQQGHEADAMKQFDQALGLLSPALQEVSPDSYGEALAGRGEAELASEQPDRSGQTLQQLDAFNHQHKATSESQSVLDAELLRSHLYVARGDVASAMKLAAVQGAIASRRWGECSSRAQAFARLATGKPASTDGNSGLSCAASFTAATMP
ncbi:MAG TPA: serine/threonine-protein kinase [Rhodanobacter sp.]